MTTICGALTATAACKLPARPGFHTCEEHALQEDTVLALAAVRNNLAEIARAAIEAKLRAEGTHWLVDEKGTLVIANGTEAAIKRAFRVEEIRQNGGDAHLRYGVRCYDALKKYHILFVDTTPEAALIFAQEECG